uniref:Helicase ATP-binding domain-containing protein n=1 Tax=viral metagenome TaxID=1070528 RepID=A0A6C0DZ69_9ZZZZ
MAQTYLTHYGYHIDINSISNDKFTQIISDLTVHPMNKDLTEKQIKEATFEIYKYSDDRTQIIVPRYYGIQRYGIPDNITFEPEETVLEFKKELKETQKEVIDKCIKYMKTNGGGLLSVPCGFGKTVCALYIASKLGYKTLIVVNRSSLLKQWVDRIKEFMNIDEKNIGIIRQQIIRIDNKDIVVGMLATMARRELTEFYKQFGLVIFDEAHFLCCKSYSKALLQIGAKYTLSMTATPYRGDGLIKIMYWFCGGTIYRERLKMNKNVVVKVINYKSTNKNLFVSKKRWFQGEQRSDTIKMGSNLAKINDRNILIINIINFIRKYYPERKILVLNKLKQHSIMLKKEVDRLIKQDVENNIIDEDDIKTYLYNGDTPANQRLSAETDGDIIFGTYQMMGVGIDIAHLNTLILASPQKDVMQSTGRIMRKTLVSGSVRPLIIDISDDLDCFTKWRDDRQIYYKTCKYKISNYYAKNNKFVIREEYDGENTNLKLHDPNIFLHNQINDFNEIQNELNQNNLLPVYETYKNTDLLSIFHVNKLTPSDFETVILKDAENTKTINLNEDINFDDENEKSLISSIKNIKDNKYIVPTKRLF